MNEFEIIERYFSAGPARAGVVLGIGDDAAVVRSQNANGISIALSTLGADGAGRPRGAVFARRLTRSAFNRLAARGAAPDWVTLGLTLDHADAGWLEDFSRGLADALGRHGAALIGGDTTRGPLSATLVAHGAAPGSDESARGVLKAGDGIYVTGTLGDAATGGEDDKPARVIEGCTAWPFTAAALALDESLAATLLRMTEPSGFGVELDASRLPAAAAGAGILARRGGGKIVVEASADAELCFAVNSDREQAFAGAMAAVETPCTAIGRIVDAPGLHLH